MKNLRLCWAAFGLCVSLGVSAQRGSCGTGVSWALADGTLTISGEGNMTDFTDPRYGSSNLPSWDIYKDNIVKVVIEGGVKHVGSYAFYDYSNLQAVTFAEGVKSIGSSAFYGCEGIKELLFPSSMKIISGQHNTNEDAEPQVSTFGMGGTGTAYMSSEAFRGCAGLTSVTIPRGVIGVGSGTFKNCRNLKSVYWDVADYPSYGFSTANENGFRDYGTQGSSPFSGCRLKEVVFGSEVDSIPGGLLYGQSELSAIKFSGKTEYVGKDAFKETVWFDNLPNGLVYIDKAAYAFKGLMSTPTAISIAEGTKSITEGLFANQTYLTKVTVPSTLTYMGYEVFEGCRSLGEVEWNAEDCKFGQTYGAPFSATALYTITFGEKVRKIPDGLCSGCRYITEVKMPASVVEVGESAFSDCSGLEAVGFSENMTSIEARAFLDCAKLSELILPNSLREIGENAFSGCTGLETLSIPESVDSIGRSAFYNTEKLVSLTMGKKVRKIDYRAFDDCTALDSVYWNAEAFRGNGSEGVLPHTFRKIVFGESVEYVPVGLCKDNANLTMVKMGSHIRTIGASAFKQCTALKEVVLPPDVASIEESAFYGCTALQAVDFPASLEYIGNTAFANTGLTSLFILSTVKSFGTYAFSQNKELEWVVIAKDPFQHPNGLFGSCDKLQAIYLPDGINFYENYGWSYYGDKIRPIALYNGHEHVYNGYYPDMTCAINIPDGYEFKEMKVEGDIPTGVGEYEIPVTFTFTGTRNFEILSPYRCTIYPKELSVKAKDCTKIYGEKNPEFELEYDGFVEGEDASVLTELPVASCDATETSVADTIYGYPIYLSGGKADNYTFVFTGPGKLYIAPASQFITWDQDLSNLHVGDKVALEASSTSGQLVTFGLAEGDEELAMLHWSDGIGTLECLGEGTVTLTACQYSSDRNYKNAEPVVKILTISKADGIGAEKVSSMEVYGLHGHIRVRGMKAGLPLRVYTSDGVLLHEETCDGSNMDLAVPCSGLYLVKAGDKTVKLIMK